MDCTIVIATYNRSALLDTTLDRLEALPERAQIVVADNGSTDGTAELVLRRHPGVRLLRLPHNIGAAARTQAARIADTRYVAFCDDDCWWRPGAIARGVELLEAHPDVALVNARVLVRGEREDRACSLMAESPVPKRSACPGKAIASFMAGASIVRRDAFLAAGGYHERYHIGGEESLLALDLLAQGWELIYAADLTVQHFPHGAGRVPEQRRRMVLRNRLWTAWLRRSSRTAWLATARLVAAAVRDSAARSALRDALGGLPWILRERRPLATSVEALLDGLTELPA